MSERDEPVNPTGPEVDFIDLFDATESGDVGIRAFDKKMEEVAKRLSERYVGKEVGDLQDIEEEQFALAREWSYVDKTARVSGRVYVDEAAEPKSFPKEWGDLISKDGTAYYFLDDVALRSCGIQVNLVRKGDELAVIGVKAAYSFAYDTADSEGESVLFAYPEELSRHEYETPTPEEAESRLRRHWPEQFKVISHLVKPDLETALPGRLKLMTRKLQPQLLESEDFRMLVEIYLDEHLGFNNDLPYIVTTEGSFLCYEGTDSPYDETAEGSWTKLIVQKPVTFLVYAPVARTFLNGNNGIQIDLAGEVYNAENDRVPDFVRFDVTLLSQFRSTFAQKAIMDRVITSVLSFESGEDPLGSVETRLMEPIRAELAPENLSYPTISDIIREMMMLETELERAKSVAKEAKSTVYPTADEAYQASASLVDGQLKDMLVGAGIHQGYLFRVAGDSVLVPNATNRVESVSGSTVFTYAISDSEAMVSLDDGDSLFGTVETLTSSIGNVIGPDGSVIGYYPNPGLVLHVSASRRGFAVSDGISFSEIEQITRAFVPLASVNESSQLKISELELFYAANESLKKAATLYKKHPIVGSLQELHKETSQEASGVFYAIPNKELFIFLASQAVDLKAKKLDPAAAIEAIESILVDRTLRIEGEAIAADTGLRLEPNAVGGTFIGRAVYVGDDITRDGLNITIKLDDTKFAYIPFSSIKDFSF